MRQGYAWWFRKYSKDETLGRLEAEARQAKRGLWADAKPMPPWEWREAKRQPEVQASSVQVVPNGVEIAALLPNPTGKDEGNEQVVIRNATDTAVDLAGWTLRDRAGNVFALSGTVPARGKLTVTMTEPTMPLNNDGDEVVLIDAEWRGAEPGGVPGKPGEGGGVDRVPQARGQVGMPFSRPFSRGRMPRSFPVTMQAEPCASSLRLRDALSSWELKIGMAT